MNTLSIFNQTIRTSNNLYSLNDLHKASGGEKRHVPSRFIRLDQTQELIKEIHQNPDLGFTINREVELNRSSDLMNAIKTQHGGLNSGTWVCKELVYAYAMWISAKFHLQVIRAFDAMMTGEQYQMDFSKYHFPLETASPSDRKYVNSVMTPKRLLENRAPELELLDLLERDGYDVEGVRVRIESLRCLAEYQQMYNDMFTELHSKLDVVTKVAESHKNNVWGKNVVFERPKQNIKRLDY